MYALNPISLWIFWSPDFTFTKFFSRICRGMANTNTRIQYYLIEHVDIPTPSFFRCRHEVICCRLVFTYQQGCSWCGQSVTCSWSLSCRALCTAVGTWRRMAPGMPQLSVLLSCPLRETQALNLLFSVDFIEACTSSGDALGDWWVCCIWSVFCVEIFIPHNSDFCKYPRLKREVIQLFYLSTCITYSNDPRLNMLFQASKFLASTPLTRGDGSKIKLVFG